MSRALTCLLAVAIGLCASGCTAIALGSAVVGAGVTVASTAVGAGVAVGKGVVNVASAPFRGDDEEEKTK
jgi:hypothetical protein